jgi:hypothetical protein
MSTLQPLETTGEIRGAYYRYLLSLYPARADDLRAKLAALFGTPELLVKGPFLESAPPYESGASIEDLVKEGVLAGRFGYLPDAVMPFGRPLYAHQERAIRRVTAGRNLIVATGTGSGKTESFLVPILNHLLREQEAGTLGQAGVRALLLYPMNALANDQVKRLRGILSTFPEITFGRYTGETKETEREGRDHYAQHHPNEKLLSNEMVSRERMRREPPHFLLTNYAMLEYLLLRPEDVSFFDGRTAASWKFIVLDEAHTYDGAVGIEVGMLLRRLKDRLAKVGNLQCIATSATLGSGRGDYPLATAFASELFGEPFEWDELDSSRQDVVEAVRLETIRSEHETWGPPDPIFYSVLSRSLNEALKAPEEDDSWNPAPSANTILRTALSPYCPERIVAASLEAYQAADSGSRSGAFLYAILHGDQRVQVIQDLLADSRFTDLPSAARYAFGSDSALGPLVDLVGLAARARPVAGVHSLLPARYHLFARALEGAYVCLNRSGHADGQVWVSLARHATCPVCEHAVHELAVCSRCGASYVVGEESEGRLRPLTTHRGRTFLLADDVVAEPDEDDEVLEESLPVQTTEVHLCLKCGALSPTQGNCTCGGRSVRMLRPDVGLDDVGPRKCASCQAKTNASPVYRLVTGADAPVSVLATALYSNLPGDDVLKPGDGRKLLIFADSRQDAAFFAPYLERTYEDVLRRRLIVNVLENPPVPGAQLRIADLVNQVAQRARDLRYFGPGASETEQKQEATRWVMRDVFALDRRQSLEGVGLAAYRPVKPSDWRPPPPLLQPPFSLSADEAWSLVALLFGTLREQGVMTLPNGVRATDEAFAPRKVEVHVREARPERLNGATILSWQALGSRSRRLDILDRLLKGTAPNMPEEKRRHFARETLGGLWRFLTGPSLRDYWADGNLRGASNTKQLDYRMWEAVHVKEVPLFACTRCLEVASIALRNLCPRMGCTGTLKPLEIVKPYLSENHYRHLYQTLRPTVMRVEEHTAQWSADEAARIQQRFI